MKRYLEAIVTADLKRKMVLLTGPRQVGKTTLAQQLMQRFESAQYLNWDIPADRAVLRRQTWAAQARLLVFDEIHKMPGWKAWLKGVVDARPAGQALLVTGSARMDTWRQSGQSLAGRYVSLRLHPLSVREWCEQHAAAEGSPPPTAADMSADAALAQLLRRGGFPEPCLAPSDIEAERWRRQYATDLIREDVMEFSRLHEVNTMRVFFEMLREHAGLHYLRTKDGAEVDFCLSGGGVLTYLIECKLTDAAPHRALVRFATQFVQAQAVQLVHTLRHNESRPPVHIEKAAPWLMRLAA